MTTRMECHVCGNFSFKDGGDGFYYCSVCSSQADDIVDTGVDDEDLFGNKIYSQTAHRSQPTTAAAAEDISQFKQTQSQQNLLQDLVVDADTDAGDGVGPTGPSDFGSYPENLSYDDYYSEIRSRYLMGYQILIQLQCKALVEKFKVSPLIIGLVGPIWLRYLAFTRIMADDWADQVIHESESQKQGDAADFHPSAKQSKEPHNIFGQRAVTLWHISLRRTIPLSHSLAINFLVCLLAREAILPTDILKWILEGKLPYFAAFVEIEKQLGPPPSACPISSSHMFRPKTTMSAQKLEALAGSIAQKINLELPPVNFYGIASRFVGQLSIPVKSILQQAFRIYEWSMPPELYISANILRLPTRIWVMSILIVAIRILYNLNGSGKWEKSLSSSRSSSSLAGKDGKQPTHATNMTDDAEKDLSSHDLCLRDNASDDEEFELDAVDLLKILETKYDNLRDTYDYSKGLTSYLQHCKDVVFAGSGQSFEDYEEEKIIEDLWEFYQNKGVECLEDQEMNSFQDSGLHQKRSMDDMRNIQIKNKECRYCKNNLSEDGSQYSMDEKNYSSRFEDSSHEGRSSMESRKVKAIRELKLDMETNRFAYIPPRQVIMSQRYISYNRRRIEGAFVYAAHADYYILLRACARVAQVDVRSLHIGVLEFEKRLKQLEEKMGKCLHLKIPSGSSGFCANEDD
nr:TATA box-binding protein-associated factor RNA polymerase I subunit B [Coffea arabica]